MNKQINMEYFSAFLYLAMAEWLLQNDYVGASHWMFVQYREELNHAEGIVQYLRRVGEPVELEVLEKPKKDFDSILSVFQEALAHEELITASINEIVTAAMEAKDYSSVKFLDWYVMEQVEEEENQKDNILGVECAHGHAAALMHFDAKLGTRVFTPEPIPFIN